MAERNGAKPAPSHSIITDRRESTYWPEVQCHTVCGELVARAPAHGNRCAWCLSFTVETSAALKEGQTWSASNWRALGGRR